MMTARQFAGMVLLAGLLAGCAGPRWQDGVAGELPILGHRNWVVIADSAYPAQTGRGVVTAYAGGEQLEAVRSLLEMIAQSPHVRPHIFLDSELGKVSEQDAPGISAYRTELGRLLEGLPAEQLPHEKIISMLDEAAQTFEVLTVKTGMVLPYTSVFIRLECGYWSDAAERRLRRAMGG